METWRVTRRTIAQPGVTGNEWEELQRVEEELFLGKTAI